ncbi:nicotinate phosphoribosyltransferase [Fomitiporia mediterranea MF3/22]|uniref:nicotinate phosphoribosyltransferase n=1 Tax=Fomitiporia mediterranea (strain MF3/22) TaxID=694068 RepID=UPI00044096DB|nr:nicotinate phosphoribosyltransferase [Fomitiporia mediterranea MF3/22]EJD02414.1 nicotinate phosphoribosyltransferase [Fomitiporia mediterranea MF3/22]
MPRSLLDTDLYKLTMQQAVLRHFPDVQATYRFTHRDEDVYFTRECYERYISTLPHFNELIATPEEIAWLRQTCPFFGEPYLEYLAKFRFKPEQLHVEFKALKDDPNKGRLEISAVGPWVETILWEVPLMACLSEIYFRTADTDWSYDSQEEIAYEKAKTLLQADIQFSEFGTRRRRSYYIQDLVVATLIRASNEFPDKGKVVGTSNMHLAFKYGIKPIGTIAHEWFMGVASLRGYEGANGLALDLWEKVYPDGPLIALTDTFSTEVFFKDFTKDKERALRWHGLRQDSGDPFVYAPLAKEIYESMGIDYRKKSIIYSDALTDEKALKIKAQCDELGITCSFGIGTFLTNDFRSVSSGGKQKSKALNMVIKIANVNGAPCIKISDEITKNTGDPAVVKKVKEMYGLRIRD